MNHSYTIKLTRVFTCLSLLCFQFNVLSQDGEIIQTKGKEFWIGFMKNYELQGDAKLDIFITSDQNTTGTVSVPLQGWTQNFVVNANVTTTVTVPNNIAETLTFGSLDQTGVLVETADTVAVFAINFKGFTADGMKCLPMAALGTEYRVAAYQGLEGYDYNSEMMVVATADDTEIEITPSTNTSSGQLAGVTYTIQMDQGESYQLKAQNWDDDLTGSLIAGTEASGPCRPFAVFSGSDCPNIPYGCTACDHVCEQNFPTDAWGTEFILVPFSLANSYTYKILAHQDGTQVTVNGGAPINLDAGDSNEYNNTSNVLCIQSNLPINVIQYMEGLDCGGAGDPAMLILDDVNQSIQNITFSTVESVVITQHNVNLIVSTVDVGEATLDGVSIPVSAFDVVPSCPDFSYAQIDINEGSHTLDAPDGVTGYVYGTGGYESYAYSVGSFRHVPGVIIDQVLCATETDTLYIGLEGDYNNIFWVNSAFPEDTLGYGAQFIIYPPIESGVYIGTGYEFISDCQHQELFSVEIPEQPINVSIAEPDAPICQFQAVQLISDVDPFNNYYQYSWSPAFGLDNPTSATPLASPFETTEYTLTVTSPGGCNYGTGIVTVEVNPGSIAGLNVTPPVAYLCTGDQVQLEANYELLILSDLIATNFDSNQWEDVLGGIASDDCGAGNQNALYFNGGGTRSATTIAVDVSNGGTVHFLLKVADGAPPCDDTEAGENIILAYSTGGPFNTIATYNEAAYPNFTELFVSIPLAAYSANTRFRWSQPIFSGAGEDNWAIDQIYISAIEGAPQNLEWTPSTWLSDATDNNPLASPEGTITYTVTLSDGGSCEYNDSTTVSVFPAPDIAAGSDIEVCGFTEVVLQAEDNADLPNLVWQWSPPEYLQTPNSSSTLLNDFGNFSQTYIVTASNAGVCEDSDTIFVNILLPYFGLGPDIEYCESWGEVWLYANGPFDGVYEWSTGQTGQSITVTEEGMYWVEVTSGVCITSDTINVTLDPGPALNLGPDQTLCSGGSIILDAGTDAGYYQWNDFSTGQTLSVSTPGTYSVTVWDDNFNCSAFDEVVVAVGTIPVFNIGNDVELCDEDNYQLNANIIADTYLWSTGESTTAITVSQSGNYSLTVNNNGCEGDDDIDVSFYFTPVFSLGDDLITCDEVELTLQAAEVPGATYLWSTGETTSSIVVNDDGNYWAEVTIGPCSYSDTLLFVPTAFEPYVFMPNIFTPNGDGKNEKFGPVAQDIRDYQFRIYNRWGELLFETNDFEKGWHGKIDNEMASSGVYFYTIRYEELCTGKKIDYDGAFSLIGAE